MSERGGVLHLGRDDSQAEESGDMRSVFYVLRPHGLLGQLPGRLHLLLAVLLPE